MLVANTNKIYEDSEVHQTINLVAVEEVVGYTETTRATDFDRLLQKSDGYMDEVHTIRDQVWADAVILLRRGSGGRASAMLDESTDFADYAFGVSGRYTSTFAHELGHIMGLLHDRYVECGSSACDRAVSADAYGYVNQKLFDQDAPASARWRTIMAYAAQCVVRYCATVWYFSNPANCYPGDCPDDGDPMGVRLTESNRNSTAVDGPANAARVLNMTRDTVAEFRQGRAVKVSFKEGSYAVTEGGAVTVTVQLDAAPGRPLTLPIPLTATSTDGAWSGDYDLPESLTFGAHQTERTFTFTATQDSRQENTETVTLGFGTPLPAGVSAGSQATATVTLTDDGDTVAAAPRVSTVDFSSAPGGGYAAGEAITVAVVFTKPISVTGTPQLALTVGTHTRQAQCAAAASEVLTCTYTVVADERDTDGVSIAANSLALNGGTIQDRASPPQAATSTALNHDAVAANSEHPVDGVTPDLQTATINADRVTLTYDGALDATSVPWASAFTVTAGSETRLVKAVRVAGAVVTLTLVSPVVHSDNVTLAYSPPSGTPALQDAAGNVVAGFSGETVTNTTPDYDTDDDGLIDITTLAQLDAMRHDSNGNGIPGTAGAGAYAAAFPGATRVVCGTTGECQGYELRADLDFDTNGDGQVDAADAYWNNGAGWDPIDLLNTTFEGNGHTISHLLINRPSYYRAALIRTFLSVIRNIGLINVQVSGQNEVGGLVGFNLGTITASYATGRVSGQHRVGGLVGQNFLGTITTSYATGRVSGSSHVGGLVGDNLGTITASYATGRVSGQQIVGGLVGRNQPDDNITASYATGRVSGSSQVGGLVGLNAGTVTHSYWDTTTSGYTTSAGGTGQTSPQLQTPTGYSGIYADWNLDLDNDNTNDDPWDFGTSSQYPALTVDFDGNGTASWQEFGHQLRESPTLSADTTTVGQIALSWTAVTDYWGAAAPITYTVLRDDTALAEDRSPTTYTDTTVTSGRAYTYQVIALVDGGEATRSARLAVTAVANQPPTFDDGSSTTRSVAENTTAGVAIGEPVAATDLDDTTLTYSLGGTDAGSFTITSTGQLRTQAALDYETKRTYRVIVRVSDGKDATGTADATIDDTITVTITVTNVNEPVVAGDDSFTLPEDTAPALSVLANDHDPEGVSLLPVLATPPSHGTAIVETNGRITYTPTEHFTGTDAFSYTVTDGTYPATATVTLTVTPVNDAPVFPATESGMRSVPENTGAGSAIGTPVQAIDVDDPTLTYTLSGPDAAAFTLDAFTGQLRTKAALNYEDKKRYTATVTAADTAMPPAPASRAVTITVTDIDEAGRVTLPPQPLVNASFTATLADPDQPLTALTWQWARSQTQGNWADIPRATAATYKPVADDEGYYLRVQVAYTDVHGDKSLTAVSSLVEKKDSNEPPEFEEGTSATRTIAENTPPGDPIGNPVTATDPDDRASVLRYALSGRDAMFFAIDASGQLSVGEGTVLDYETRRSYTVTVTVTDPFNATDRIAVTIAVRDVNEVPVFPAPTATRSIAEDTAVGQTLGPPVTATDDDRDPLTYSLDAASETVFTIDERTGQVRTQAALDHETTDSYFVTIRVSDGKDEAGAPDPATDATLDVTVLVTDAPGRVTVSPTRPLVGRGLTATVADPDAPVSLPTWRWERSADGVTWSLITGATTARYTPATADQGHALRATVTYTDADGTAKAATSVQTQRVGRRGGGRPAEGSSGGGGSGGGVPACAEDVHGNSAAQATVLPLDTETAGTICPAADVDYFTVIAPGPGLVFVDTFGGVQPRGTLWQHERVVAAGPTRGGPQDARLGARVQAGPVVVALQGQGGATGAYAVVVTFVQGYLENPGPDSFQSGIGVISGWVCAAEVVEIELNGMPQEAAYGTERLDTAGVCGDTDNGFGLLFNWNLLGDGAHAVVAYVDGVELGQATVTVTTLGQEFVRGVGGECVVEDFPSPGERVTLVWQQNSQNFVMARGSPPAGASTGRASGLTGFLENPGHNSFQSGVRVLSGWVCEADEVEVELGHLGRQGAAYGTERLDTAAVCGDTDNGFGLLFNWNLLGEGEHEVVAFVDGEELGRATVRVTTLGAEFVRGVEGECVVVDFPEIDQTVALEWQQTSQNFVIVEVE